MNDEDRTEAIFGAFDGTVSTIGFVFGLLVHGSPGAAIAAGGLGGAIAATISMTSGEYESREEPARQKIGPAAAMGASTLLGSLVPVWPFYAFSRDLAIGVAAVGCVLVAAWIGHEKGKQKEGKALRGYAISFATLFGAVGLTLAIVSAIPQSGG